MPKQCVNGNCSRRKECGTYHQAVNLIEARCDDGRFERYTCKNGECKHFSQREETTEEILARAMGIVNRYGQIVEIVNRFENEENYNSLAAIEAVAKIVTIKGEVTHG
jgi:hypothetical protein